MPIRRLSQTLVAAWFGALLSGGLANRTAVFADGERAPSAKQPQASRKRLDNGTPQALLRSIYSFYADDKVIPELHWNDKDAALLFEPNLAAAIVRDADESGARGEVSERLEIDPFIVGQDFNITGLSIVVLSRKKDVAEARVRFRNCGDPTEIHYTLVRLAHGWRIREMRWGHSSLRAVYGVP